MNGLIKFDNDPIEQQIKYCQWSARLERGTGIWFDFDLVFEHTDKKRFVAVESRISSTYWPNNYGIHASTLDKPFMRKNLNSARYDFDPNPSLEICAFSIYQNSQHMMTGNHLLKLKLDSDKNSYRIDWRGEIAEQEDPIEYHASFHIVLKGIKFEGIKFPPSTTEKIARQLLEGYVADAAKLRFSKRKEFVALT